MSGSILEVRNLSKAFPVRGGLLKQLFQRTDGLAVRAVDDISFDLAEGEVLGIVGESGCGKSTTGMMILNLVEPSSGTLRFRGSEIPSSGNELLRFRRQAQMIFQDPYQSLNPRFTVFDIVSEPLIIHRLGREPTMRAQVIEILDQVGLRPAASYLHRFPHELSGGQRQRVAIARAVVLQPRLMVADEPVSMLDVSVRAGILRLLRSFSRDFGLSVIYISHDISTVRYLCDRVAVMYLGRIVETRPYVISARCPETSVYHCAPGGGAAHSGGRPPPSGQVGGRRPRLCAAAGRLHFSPTLPESVRTMRQGRAGPPLGR